MTLRTCEIFNAEALVVSSLKIKQDETFKSLAVTSDKWVPMIEVKIVINNIKMNFNEL